MGSTAVSAHNSVPLDGFLLRVGWWASTARHSACYYFGVRSEDERWAEEERSRWVLDVSRAIRLATRMSVDVCNVELAGSGKGSCIWCCWSCWSNAVGGWVCWVWFKLAWLKMSSFSNHQIWNLLLLRVDWTWIRCLQQVHFDFKLWRNHIHVWKSHPIGPYVTHLCKVSIIFLNTTIALW